MGFWNRKPNDKVNPSDKTGENKPAGTTPAQKAPETAPSTVPVTTPQSAKPQQAPAVTSSSAAPSSSSSAPSAGSSGAPPVAPVNDQWVTSRVTPHVSGPAAAVEAPEKVVAAHVSAPEIKTGPHSGEPEGRIGGSAPAARASHESIQDFITARYGNVRSALGVGTIIQGKLTFDTPVRIDGKLSGEIYSTTALIVGPQGVVDARVEVAALVVMGSVKGSVKASGRIELYVGGKVNGDLETPVLMIEEGAEFNGHCSMLAATAASGVESKKAGNESGRSENAEKASEASPRKTDVPNPNPGKANDKRPEQKQQEPEKNGSEKPGAEKGQGEKSANKSGDKRVHLH